MKSFEFTSPVANSSQWLVLIALLHSKERLNQSDAEQGFILDGFPRNMNQAKLLETITQPEKIIEITLPDQEAIRRLSGRLNCKSCGAIFNKFTNPPKQENICDNCQGELAQRGDDKEDAVKKRLTTYHNETEPILEYYGEKVIKINGEQPIEDIAKEIEEKVK